MATDPRSGRTLGLITDTGHKVIGIDPAMKSLDLIRWHGIVIYNRTSSSQSQISRNSGLLEQNVKVPFLISRTFIYG